MINTFSIMDEDRNPMSVKVRVTVIDLPLLKSFGSTWDAQTQTRV